MTFLNPFILFGLIAAGIPILLHLLNLRKLRTVEFSTLSFLKELQRTKIRRIKIRQWLLLLLRTLLVVLVVMAFARPTLEGSFAGVFGEQAKTTSVFILDDSQSMTALDDLGERFQQAKDAALRVTDLLKDGDEVFLLKLSEVGTSLTGITPTRNFELLRSAIRESKASHRHSTLEDALRVSSRLLASSTNFNKEVFLFSDFQAGGVTSNTSATLAREGLFPESVRFYVVDSGKRDPNNLGIESLTIANSIFEPGKAFTLTARIMNAGGNSVQNHIVSLFLNGERVAQKGVDIPSGSSANVDFTAIPKAGGILEGMLELEPDDLEFDNRRYFTLNIPERVRVLLVGSSPDIRFIRLALGAQQISTNTALQIRESTPERLSATDIGTADVAILAGLRSLGAAQASRLESFLNAGGGVIVFPGQQTEQNTFNLGVAEKIGLPPIARIESLQQPGSDVESYIGFDNVELQHPLFRGMFDEEQSGLQPGNAGQQQRSVESPRILKFVQYQLPARAQSIITLSNRTAFLAEVPLQGGRALLYNVAALPGWSDFPFRGLFVPLLHRSVSYLAQGASQQRDVLVGDEQMLRSRIRSSDRWTVVSPTSIETVVQPSSTSAESVIRFNETTEPGIYHLQHGNTAVQKFAVNMHPDESKTAHINEDDLETMFTRLGIPQQSLQHIEAGVEMQQQILQARFGVELWKHFLLAALVIALAEMFVARDSKVELASLQTVQR